MKIERQTVGTVDVLTPCGALVDQDGQHFTEVLLERVKLPNPRVVVCMSDVPYMDSTAVEGLLDATDAPGTRTAGLKLAGVTQACREIMELTGVSRHFGFFKTVQDAVKAFL